MSNSPQNKPTGTDAPNSKVQFTTKNIGSWKRKQENPFAEQNRKNQAKKQERNKKREKATPYVVVISAITVISLAIWGLVVIIVALSNPKDGIIVPTITGSSEEDIVSYRDQLQQFYNQKKDEQLGEDEVLYSPDLGMEMTFEIDPQVKQELLNDVEQTVQNTLNTPNGRKNANAVLCAQAYLYYNNGYYQEVVDVLQQIDLEQLSNNVKINIYEVAANSYYLLGDEESANEYYDLLFSTQAEDVND